MTGGFRLAERSQAKPLIGIYSESGCGKTKSALLLARGFVGPAGKIGMIETEAGRGEVYVGETPIGDYLVRPIRGHFSPEEYGKAITEAEQAKVGALIIDSASHGWEGAGGVLSMAADNQAKGMKGVLVWQQPKMQHQRHFMLRMMQTPIPLVILCMRARYPMVEKPNNKGGKDWVRSETLEPKQADDILFEMMVHGWIDAQHRWHGTKYTVPALRDAIRDNEPITIESGRRLAAWSSSRTASAPSAAPTARPADDAQVPSPQEREGAAGTAEGGDATSGAESQSAGSSSASSTTTSTGAASDDAPAGDTTAGGGFDVAREVKALRDGFQRETTLANVRSFVQINDYSFQQLKIHAPAEYAALGQEINRHIRDLKAKAPT